MFTFVLQGMLISGELYIHLKDRTVQDEKIEEMLRSISTHINKVENVLESDTTDSNNHNTTKQHDLKAGRFQDSIERIVSLYLPGIAFFKIIYFDKLYYERKAELMLLMRSLWLQTLMGCNLFLNYS